MIAAVAARKPGTISYRAKPVWRQSTTTTAPVIIPVEYANVGFDRFAGEPDADEEDDHHAVAAPPVGEPSGRQEAQVKVPAA